MFKPMLVAAAALAIGGSSIVYAQQHLGEPGGYRDGSPGFEQRHRLSAADMAAFTDARIAALKAGLELTPDQAKNWPAFEQALRDMAQLRMERRQAREAAEQQQSEPPITPFERLAKRADNLSKTGAALKHIADTGAPLFQSLDDAQKHRFKMLAHLLRPHHHHMHAGWEGGGGHGWREGMGMGMRRGGESEDHGWVHPGGRIGEDEGGPGGRMHHMMSTDDEESQL